MQADLVKPRDSNYPWQHTVAGFHSMAKRLLNLLLRKDVFDQEKYRIKVLAVRKGYK